jgi:2-iminobutanoate/2-iminopropanoate deaminase
MRKKVISTPEAPGAIGPYSQAIKTGLVVFLSGQVGLDPATKELVGGGFEAQVRQSFANLSAVAKAAGGTLADAVKFTLFLTDLGQFAKANEIMSELVPAPYPARSTIGVSSLPRGAQFEVEAILVVGAE